jgi:hypothetical protein
MIGNTVAHVLGVLVLIGGLVANLRRRLVLSKLLALCGVAIAHLPDLLGVVGVP